MASEEILDFEDEPTPRRKRVKEGNAGARVVLWVMLGIIGSMVTCCGSLYLSWNTMFGSVTADTGTPEPNYQEVRKRYEQQQRLVTPCAYNEWVVTLYVDGKEVTACTSQW